MNQSKLERSGLSVGRRSRSNLGRLKGKNLVGNNLARCVLIALLLDLFDCKTNKAGMCLGQARCVRT